MGRPFSTKKISLYEIPKWEPGKFWLRWMDDTWAVKGSPEKSTFVTAPTWMGGTLSQDEIRLMSQRAKIAS